jgi:YegS/Rv2252/BmrU family lipid kinase
MSETLFVINPVSARGETLRNWARARQELEGLGVSIIDYITPGAGEATEITREALQRGLKRVVAVGGDGTLNEVVNGYFDKAGQVINPTAAVGLLPSGTGSDFRRSLGLKNRADAIRAIARSRIKSVDVGRITFSNQQGARTSQFFINVVTFGLGGEVSARISQWRKVLPKWVGGRARFTAAAICALKRYRNVSVCVVLDREREIKLSSNLIVIANGRFAGCGMMLAPHAEIDDGLFDVILTDRATRFDVLKELLRIQRGAYLKNPKVNQMRAREVSIMSDEVMATDIDGEPTGFTPAYLTVLPSAIRFLV